tara:strand:- start:3364 stop:3663 length:300 start_codon:yes stop_codon:yes gene_type:complete
VILKLKEVYRNQPGHKRMAGSSWSVRDIVLNAEHIVYIRPDQAMSRRLNEGLIFGLESSVDFCTISINRGQSGTDVTVVGSVKELEEAIRSSKKELLHG